MENKGYKKILYTASILLMLATIFVLFFYAPVPIDPGERGTALGPDGQMHYTSTESQWTNYVYSFHISYFHIPIALTAYLAFFLVLVFSVRYLHDGQQEWDIKAVSAAHVGLVFAGLTLISGSIWAGAAWGHYWPPGDIRLNTSLVLFFIYAAYLMIRHSVEMPEKRARLSAVFGIIGFISVPISFFSIRIWSGSTTHPLLYGEGGGGISGTAVIFPMVMNLVSFVLVCISLILYKTDNLTLEEELMATKLEKGV